MIIYIYSFVKTKQTVIVQTWPKREGYPQPPAIYHTGTPEQVEEMINELINP